MSGFMSAIDEISETAIYKSTTTRTYAQLRNAIVTAGFQPGERLRIDSLKEKFAASLGAVREALARLTSEGLVVAEPQRGFFVSLVSRRDLIDLTETRVVIEQICLESSVASGDLAWEGRVLSVAHKLSRLSYVLHDPGHPALEKWHHYHWQFHREITSACTNTWWLKLRDELFIQSERYRRLSAPTAKDDRDVDAEHRAITDAVLSRDVERSKNLLVDHLQNTTAILLASRISFAENYPCISKNFGKGNMPLSNRD